MSESTEQTTAIARIPATKAEISEAIDRVTAGIPLDVQTADAYAPVEDAPAASAGVPWIGFRSDKTKSRVDELNAAGVQPNQFYLYDLGIVAPKPFYVHALYCFEFFSQVDDENKMLAARGIVTQAQREEGFSNHLHALCLVRLPGPTPQFVAALFSQRKAMTRCMDSLREGLRKLSTDTTGRDFSAKGPKFAEAYKAAGWPQFALRAKIWGETRLTVKTDPRTKKAIPYNHGLSSIEPTPLEDVAALNRYVGLEEESYPGEDKKNTGFGAALTAFVRRCSEARSLIAKTEANDVGE